MNCIDMYTLGEICDILEDEYGYGNHQASSAVSARKDRILELYHEEGEEPSQIASRVLKEESDEFHHQFQERSHS
jgi:hypothetical protein